MILLGASDDLQLFKDACTSVITDKGFNLGTERSQRARFAADRLLKFIEGNEKKVEPFAKTVLRRVRECCFHPRAVTCHTFRERMWENYYKLSSNEEFISSWITFLECTIRMSGSPIFYQFVTRQVMESIIKMQFLLDYSLTVSTDSEQSSGLDFQEANALRYCGGYC